MTAPRHRWSFSLRMMFVGVMVLCGMAAWITYNAARLLERDEVFRTFVGFSFPHDGRWMAGCLIGPQPFSEFFARDNVTDSDLSRIRAAFPECVVWVVDANDTVVRYAPPRGDYLTPDKRLLKPFRARGPQSPPANH